MQKDVWIDARSLSRPYTTGWERYVQNLAAGMRSHQHIQFDDLFYKSKLNLHISDFVFPKKSKNYQVSHFPTYPPMYKSHATNQIITIHDLTWWKYPNYSSSFGKFYYKLFMEKALNDSTSIIVPSFSIKKDLLSWFNLDNNTIHVIEHGNSLPQGKFKKIKTPYFLSFGTIEPRKNLDFYSEAIKKSRLNKIFEFIHVGRIGWGTLPSVFTHVRATDQELADLIYNSQCVVIPSHYEGFGLPVLEAHYNEKHTIMSNDPALTELKLKSDLVFELGNLDSLIDQLKYAAINQLSLTQEEIQSTHRYSWNRSIKKHLEIYRKYCV